ncbi:unnamed protein product [Scytosiphon promiscuus]
MWKVKKQDKLKKKIVLTFRTCDTPRVRKSLPHRSGTRSTRDGMTTHMHISRLSRKIESNEPAAGFWCPSMLLVSTSCGRSSCRPVAHAAAAPLNSSDPCHSSIACRLGSWKPKNKAFRAVGRDVPRWSSKPSNPCPALHIIPLSTPEQEGWQRARHAVAGSQDPGLPRDALDFLSSCTSAFPVSLFLLLLLLLPITMVLRAARTTRLCLRFPTDPRAPVATTSGTNRSGNQNGDGSRPHKPIFSLGHFRKLPLLVVIGGLRSAIAVSGGDGGGDDDAKRLPAVAAVGARPDAAITHGRHLEDLPDVAFDKEGSGSEGISDSSAEWSSDLGKAGLGGDGEGMSPAESAGALLADGQPRCCLFDEGVGADGGESAGRRQRCLPTVFFLGVSKCGTTSLSDWLSHHPRIRWVRRPQHLYYLEAHVFDVPPDPKEWRQSVRSPSSSQLRDRLSVAAEAKDAVIDYTPHYSLVAEVPFRISEFYGDGPLRERGLKFLVVLREPAARTISSWMYKTDPKMASQVAKARHPEGLLASLSEKAVEVRPLKQAVEEGIEMAERLSECVANATQAGGFGHGREVKSCHGLAAGVEGCKGVEGEGEQRQAYGEGGQERGEDCEKTSCEAHIEPL